MLVCDFPVKMELADGDKFIAPSNTGLQTALRTGKVNNWSAVVEDGYQGIKGSDLFSTYLDYRGVQEGNFDYSKEIKKRKDLFIADDCFFDVDEPNSRYFKIEHQKDCYVSSGLWFEIQSLLEEIEKVKPKLIIVTGKWSLFFLTGCVTLTQNQGNYKDKKPLGCLVRYRSSLMQVNSCFEITTSHILLPIYHTQNAMGMPDKIPMMTLDLQKAGWIYHNILDQGVEYYTQPVEDFTITLDKGEILKYLDTMLARLDKEPRKVSADIETKYSALIDCIGITDSLNTGICIPFAGETNPNLWSLEDEIEITLKLFEVLQHKNCQIIGQNFFYDSNFISEQYLIDVYAEHDSMVLHHLLYNYLPKDLSFLSSIYAEKYTQWKDMQKH